MKKKVTRLTVLVLSITLISVGFVVPSIEKAYAAYMTTTTATTEMQVAKWSLKVNSESQESILIELKDTIIDNNYNTTKVIPGTKGKIEIQIDFSDTEVATTYEIVPNTSTNVIPSNLKLYTDENMTTELTSITGNVELADINTPIVKEIYWRWNFTEEDETEDWSNQDIVLELLLNTSQKIVEGP